MPRVPWSCALDTKLANEKDLKGTFKRTILQSVVRISSNINFHEFLNGSAAALRNVSWLYEFQHDVDSDA